MKLSFRMETSQTFIRQFDEFSLCLLCCDVLRLRSYIVVARKAIALESMTNRKNFSHVPQIVPKGTRNYLFDRTRIIFRDEGLKTLDLEIWKISEALI
jgi:hypothetical protein